MIAMVVALLFAACDPTIFLLSFFGAEFGALPAFGVAMPSHNFLNYCTIVLPFNPSQISLDNYSGRTSLRGQTTLDLLQNREVWVLRCG